ncbi:pyruvate kinase [Deltaproteobacteria bacterium TL4]
MSKKILMTLGPSSLNERVITQCDEMGIFLYRINLSHTPLDQVRSAIHTVHKYTKTPLSLDSEGAQIRNQRMKGGEVYFEKGTQIKIHFNDIEGDAQNISLTPQGVAQQLQEGDILRIDFDSVELQIGEKVEDGCWAKVSVEGKIGSNKAADLNREIQMPALTPKDEKAVEIGLEEGIKHFALSFASCKEDVETLRRKVGTDSYIISKIESRSGLANLAEILQASDAILIDRGDLSRQVPLTKIPLLQRRIVSFARSREKNVFVATNLLESMIKTRMPTRAEVNDVFSTLLMGADGLVLAAETAIGSYPIESVKVIRQLIKEFERWTPYSSIEEILHDL